MGAASSSSQRLIRDIMSSSGSQPARYLALIYLKPGQRDRLRQIHLPRFEDVPLGAYFSSGA